MGGVDKGLQIFQGQALVDIALQRLRQQAGGAPGLIAINANRNLADYAARQVPVWSDTVPDFAGPLAGFLAALRQCQGRFEWLLSVPCDSPLFPLDVLQRLAAAASAQQADIAMALAPEVQPDGSSVLRPQPVFCLMRTGLADSLQNFIDGGGRKIGAWTASHMQTKVPFGMPGDDARAFANANTLDELHALEKL
ncbi:MAG: molybdenum cofactor guanylyltransferase [Rhodoferax sp.]|nr:molybdenum cofactor guanylyltransferase [Rhodoferax sp.]